MRRRVRVEEESEINITPLLDIVFIMLIFFIVTATFVKESGIDVTRPDSETAQQQNRVGILIAISDKNEIWINHFGTSNIIKPIWIIVIIIKHQINFNSNIIIITFRYNYNLPNLKKVIKSYKY